MKKLQYKLTLEVEECGNRSFTAQRECESRDQITGSIAFDIAKAVEATMNCPPSGMELAGARERGYSLVAGLARAEQEWDGSSNFSDCVKIIVDFDKLKDEPGSSDETVRRVLERCGIEVKST